MATRKFSRSGRQQLINVSDFMTNKDDDIIICSSRSVLEVARIFIRTRAQWATTYVDSYIDDGYVIASPAQMDIIQEYLAQFLEDTNEMNCNDFNDALLAIGSAITDLGSVICGCSGRGGSAGAPGQEPTASTFEDDGSDFPPEFADRAEYAAYKCQIANTLIASIKADLGWVSAAGLLQLTTPLLALAFFTPVPFDDIAIIVGMVVALFLAATLSAIITAIDSFIASDAEELVCVLYEAQTAGDAKTDLKALFTAGLTTAQAGLVNLWVNFANLNALFGKNTVLEASSKTMSVNCALCSPHFTYLGTQVGPQMWISENVGGGVHAVSVAFYAIGWEDDGGDTTKLNVELGAMPGWDCNEAVGGGCFRARTTMTTGAACTGWDVYCTDTPPTGEYCMKKISFRSETAFTVSLLFGADC